MTKNSDTKKDGAENSMSNKARSRPSVSDSILSRQDFLQDVEKQINKALDLLVYIVCQSPTNSKFKYEAKQQAKEQFLEFIESSNNAAVLMELRELKSHIINKQIHGWLENRIKELTKGE